MSTVATVAGYLIGYLLLSILAGALIGKWMKSFGQLRVALTEYDEPIGDAPMLDREAA